MNDEMQRFYQVEDYLREAMTPEQKAAFEDEITANPALAEQVESQRLQRKAAQWLTEDELLKKMKSWRAELESAPVEPKVIWLRRKWVYAAAAALALVLAYFIWLNNKQESPPQEPPVVNEPPPVESPQAPAPLPEKPPTPTPLPEKPTERKAKPAVPNQLAPTKYLALAQKFREEPRFDEKSLRSGGGASQPSLLAADSLLHKKQYEPAIAHLLRLEPISEGVTYNIGCAYYAAGQYEKAIPYLQKTIESGYLYAGHARWYLALSLLATGDLSATKTQLAEIRKNSGGDYFSKAEALWDALPDAKK